MRRRVTVCELRDDGPGFAADFEALAAHVRAAGSELVLLPELPFSPWPFARRDVDEGVWDEAIASHERWLARLGASGELGDAVVLGSMPTREGGERRNRAFVAEPGEPVKRAHTKYYLPDEPGFWEASWYARGEGQFELVHSRGVAVGFSICTEIWFMERGRQYGKAGAHVLACPRATEKATVEEWLTGARVAAITSGAFVLSSNHWTLPGAEADLGGVGYVVAPSGAVLGRTSREQPFLTVDIDLAEAEAAKQGYPLYVRD